MTEMPRPRPPHLHSERTRHGRLVWYVRIGKGPRIRIRAEYGSPSFDAQYKAAIDGVPLFTGKAANGTLEWLIDRYRETSAWQDLSLATRRQRDNIFQGVLKTAAKEAIQFVSKQTITAARERRSSTPAQARNFLDAMRGLFRWAMDADLVKSDPTLGVKNPTRNTGPGFEVWTEEEVDSYQNRWPIGTKERVWIDVLLYSGLRRGDAVRLGKQHVRDGAATIATEKSKGQIKVTIPLLPVLAETLRAGPCGDLAFICGDRKQPLTKESFGNMFRVACRAAGVKKSAHGIRKVGATRAAENGATVAELEALFGWTGGGMAALYTRAANRAHLAKGAVHKLIKREDNATQAEAGKTRS
jgi:integrase